MNGVAIFGVGEIALNDQHVAFLQGEQLLGDPLVANHLVTVSTKLYQHINTGAAQGVYFTVTDQLYAIAVVGLIPHRPVGVVGQVIGPQIEVNAGSIGTPGFNFPAVLVIAQAAGDNHFRIGLYRIGCGRCGRCRGVGCRGVGCGGICGVSFAAGCENADNH